eukprot:10201023-Karenia_brevis.AAC.1
MLGDAAGWESHIVTHMYTCICHICIDSGDHYGVRHSCTPTVRDSQPLTTFWGAAALGAYALGAYTLLDKLLRPPSTSDYTLGAYTLEGPWGCTR